ncbi:hypothetical protein BU15DRAFT_67799 [Melanogaster broomeanus]|nr:hypothetical protein BU15DRAFT_67799 [Melanogaster broomeanus]
MSSASKSITPASSTAGVDWARINMPKLKSDIKDSDKIVMAKAKECHQHKVEKKCQEDEEQHLWEEEEQCCQEEEAKCCQEAEKAELRKREEEQRQCKEVQRKAAEATKKRQREEAEAGSSIVCGSGMCCMCCTKVGILCEFTNDGNKRQTACNWCAITREKCEWLEMHAPRAAKAKGKQVPTSPRQGEKKKHVHKAKPQEDDEVEIIRERMAGAVSSRISLDRLVMAIEEMLDQMGELVQVHRESTEAQRELDISISIRISAGTSRLGYIGKLGLELQWFK